MFLDILPDHDVAVIVPVRHISNLLTVSQFQAAQHSYFSLFFFKIPIFSYIWSKLPIFLKKADIQL